MTIRTCEISSPLGTLQLFVSEAGVCALGFDRADSLRWLARRFGPVEMTRDPDPDGARSRLDRYFGGELAELDSIAVDTGGTPFQVSVWEALRRIPVGTTTSYGALARSLGRPKAMRAVGLANGRNPVAIIVPCHRVVAANGSLWGYGGGLERKGWLLAHEGALSQPSLPAARSAKAAPRPPSIMTAP